MDLGATLCLCPAPACSRCPVAEDCVASRTGRTGELPQRKPARALPTRQTMMLLIRDRGEVLLEKRPSTGVWGGLWSFPEMPGDGDPVLHCARRLGLEVAAEPRLDSLIHTFTHFRLDIIPVPLRLVARDTRAMEPGLIWLNLEDAKQAAIPTPVRKLLAGMSG
jgi:A/G-specific adenine glycosylase